MDQLQRLIDICKQHYEKILLVVVLCALAFAVLVLQGIRQEEQQKLQDYQIGLVRGTKKGVPPLDLTRLQQLTNLLNNPPSLALRPPHNLVNPVQWHRKADGTLLKVETGTEVGWPQMAIKEIRPLKFRVVLQSISAGTGGVGYQLSFLDESDVVGRGRPRNGFVYVPAELNQTNSVSGMSLRVVLQAINGDPAQPQSLVLYLVELDKQITLSKGQPYEEIKGYEADLVYQPTGREYSKLRVGSKLGFLGDEYNILAITANEVVASSLRSGRRYTVSTRTAPQGQK